MANPPLPQKTRILEEEEYEIIRPYNAGKEIFNTTRYDVKIVKEAGDKKTLVIIRERKVELDNK